MDVVETPLRAEGVGEGRCLDYPHPKALPAVHNPRSPHTIQPGASLSLHPRPKLVLSAHQRLASDGSPMAPGWPIAIRQRVSVEACPCLGTVAGQWKRARASGMYTYRMKKCGTVWNVKAVAATFSVTSAPR